MKYCGWKYFTTQVDGPCVAEKPYLYLIIVQIIPTKLASAKDWARRTIDSASPLHFCA